MIPEILKKGGEGDTRFFPVGIAGRGEEVMQGSGAGKIFSGEILRRGLKPG